MRAVILTLSLALAALLTGGTTDCVAQGACATHWCISDGECGMNTCFCARQGDNPQGVCVRAP